MSEMNQKYPIYFNGYWGNGETMRKLAETLPKVDSSVQAFDFDKHRNLLSGNPFLFTK
jgi:hypothetical protein